MDFNEFAMKKLLEEKLSGQIIYRIKENSSSIDFKLHSYHGDISVFTYFRFDEDIENPNSIELNLIKYIEENNLYWITRDKILYFMINQMQGLFGSRYFYNIHVYNHIVKVSISLKDYELEEFGVFERAISDKINLLKESNIDDLKNDYQVYSKFFEMLDYCDDIKYANVKTNYILYNDFVDNIFSIKKDFFVYHFKLISNLKPMIKISFNCENKNLNPIEQSLKNIISQNYEKYDIWGKEQTLDDYINKNHVKKMILDCIKGELELLLNSNKYVFHFVNSRLNYSKITVVASLNQIDYSSIYDVFANLVREKILNSNILENSFKNLQIEWNAYKKSISEKNQLSNILQSWSNDEKEYKLNYIFETEFNNKLFFKIENSSFKIIDISKNKIKIIMKLVSDNPFISFKLKNNIIPHKYYTINFNSPYYFNNFSYSGERIGDDIITELFLNDIYNSNMLLERNIRNQILVLLLDDDYSNRLDTLWNNKLEIDEIINEEKNNEREQIKKNYEDIINELDNNSQNISGDKIRW